MKCTSCKLLSYCCTQALPLWCLTWGDILFLSCLSFTNVCTCNSSFILNKNSSKQCMLSHYHKKISISLQKFDQTIIEGAIAHFDSKYFIKSLHSICISLRQFGQTILEGVISLISSIDLLLKITFNSGLNNNVWLLVWYHLKNCSGK